MKVAHGDPQYLVLFDEQGTPLCTCVSIEARDRLIEACAKLAAAEARFERLARSVNTFTTAISDSPCTRISCAVDDCMDEIAELEDAARAEGGE